MTATPRPLELLAPAKNAQFGMEAILHGADAVYIGGPAFGARSNAGNSVEDIRRLAEFAHPYRAKVLVALNTILRDEELEPARRIAWELYEAGADALILQDMGLLELNLPPLELHASTQTDNRSPAKVKFLQDVGFSQVVLARELSLEQIRKVAADTDVALEFFIHGALCVSYSGQCYISHAHTGRSANRGECSQACRLPYTLEDQEGHTLAADQHLLSMKDNDQSANLAALAEAGIRSFKIEGRLKDLSYVKNITAHYRQLLDRVIADHPGYTRASLGRTTTTFTPLPEKTFNRGATDYFVHGRQSEVGAFDTPSFAGRRLGTVTRLGKGWFEVTPEDPQVVLHNGDGLSYFDGEGELVGLRLNTVEKTGRTWRCTPNALPADLIPGTALQRNRDQEFERLLEKKSAERRIPIRLHLEETATGFALTLTDPQGLQARAVVDHPKEPARNGDQAWKPLADQLGKLGNTLYCLADDGAEEAPTAAPQLEGSNACGEAPQQGVSQATSAPTASAPTAAESGAPEQARAPGAPPLLHPAITLALSQPWFLPAGVINALRRDAVAQLDAARAAAYQRPPRAPAVEPPALYPESDLTYLGNVYNARARAFYTRHGVELIAPAYESNEEKGAVSLMITKHCLRYSFNLCPKVVKGVRPDPLVLVNGKERLTLRFDCKKCEMHVVGKLKKHRSVQLTVQGGH